MRERRHPDLPGRAHALGTFMADFARPTGYDYWDPRDPHPARSPSRVPGATRDGGRRARFGARPGPGALQRPLPARTRTWLGSAPARTDSRSRSTYRQRRSPRDLRRDHGRLGRAHARGDDAQVRGVRLEPLDPSGEHSLGRFCAEHGVEYGDWGVPVDIDSFIAYGRWFQERLVPEVRRTVVELVQPTDGGFQLTLSSGDTLRARRVVVATGLRGFAYVPGAAARVARGSPQPQLRSRRRRSRRARAPGGPERCRARRRPVGARDRDAASRRRLLGHLVARSPNLVWNSVPHRRTSAAAQPHSLSALRPG